MHKSSHSDKLPPLILPKVAHCHGFNLSKYNKPLKNKAFAEGTAFALEAMYESQNAKRESSATKNQLSNDVFQAVYPADFRLVNY